MPAGFFDEIRDLSVEDALKYVNALNGYSDEWFKNYLDKYKEKVKLEKEIADSLYEVEQKDVDDFRKTTDETIEYLTKGLEEAGLTIPEGFFDVGEKSAAQFGEGFKAHLETMFEGLKVQVQSFQASMFQNRELALAGVGGNITSITNHNSESISIEAKGETTRQVLAEIERQKTLGRFRGK